MRHYNLAAIHDRIDEACFELRLQLHAIKALQLQVGELDAAVRELRIEAFDTSPAVKVSRHQAAPVRQVRPERARPGRNRDRRVVV